MDELRDLRDGVEGGDPEACDALRKVGQALRGSGGTFGFPELSAVAGLVETTADSDALRRLEGLSDELAGLATDEAGGGPPFAWLGRCAGLDRDELVGGADDIEDAWSAVSRRAGLDDAELAERVARRFGLRVADPASRNRAAQRLVTEALTSSAGIVPLAEDSGTITIACSDPTSLRTELEVERLTGRKPVFAVAAPAAIRAVLEDHFGRSVVRSPGGPTVPGAREGAPSDGDRPRVLVVDDEPSARLLVRALLEKRGYEAVEASDGFEALDRVRDDDAIGLAVVDLNMPGMDGLELIWNLRDSPHSAELPVIVVTGEADEILETQIMEEGADDYVRKPIDPRLFVARVEATLRRVRRPTAIR